MNLKTTQFLDAETMTRRLIAVNDMPHFQEHFYPLLTKHAGDKTNGIGVLMAVQLAIADYTEDMPPIMGNLMQREVEDWCGAMIDDADVLVDVKRANYESMLKKAGMA